MLKRYDIISDTHGHIPDALRKALVGADVIIHAGDICSIGDFKLLSAMAPLWAVLGNNDFASDYQNLLKKKAVFFGSGLTWQVCHYRQRLDLGSFDISVCGHTHTPYIEKLSTGALIINPGSPTRPRRSAPSFVRVFCDNEKGIFSADILEL